MSLFNILARLSPNPPAPSQSIPLPTTTLTPTLDTKGPIFLVWTLIAILLSTLLVMTIFHANPTSKVSKLDLSPKITKVFDDIAFVEDHDVIGEDSLTEVSSTAATAGSMCRKRKRDNIAFKEDEEAKKTRKLIDSGDTQYVFPGELSELGMWIMDFNKTVQGMAGDVDVIDRWFERHVAGTQSSPFMGDMRDTDAFCGSRMAKGDSEEESGEVEIRMMSSLWDNVL